MEDFAGKLDILVKELKIKDSTFTEDALTSNSNNNSNSNSKKEKKEKKEKEKEKLNEDFDNIQRRILYSDFCLLRLDIEEYILDKYKEITNGVEHDKAQLLMERIDKISYSIKLLRFKSKLNPIAKYLDGTLRFLGIFTSFVLFAHLCPLLLLARALEESLGKDKDPFELITEKLKRMIPLCIALQAGITLEVEGLDRSKFRDSCSVLTFSHASNYDGFYVSGTCPIRQLAFGKKELFMLPFFGWVSLAIGGIPVDRTNRGRAVQALKRAADLSKSSKMCIAIAPEGTRSTTGQLLPFKKGTFYMWEELRSPILPFVIFGSHDLFPPGSWVNEAKGYVTVRYLPPIYPEEADSRDHMMRILRRRMLLALREPPATVGQNITMGQYIKAMSVNLFYITLMGVIINFICQCLVIGKGYSVGAVGLGWVGLVVLVTIMLYVYSVYIVNMPNTSTSTNTNNNTNAREGSGEEGKKQT